MAAEGNFKKLLGKNQTIVTFIYVIQLSKSPFTTGVDTADWVEAGLVTCLL